MLRYHVRIVINNFRGTCSGSNLPLAAIGCSSLREENGWCRSDPRLSLHTHCSCGQSARRNWAKNPQLTILWPPRFGETNTTSTSMCMPITQAAKTNARCGMSDYKSHEEQEEPIQRHSNRTWHVILTKNKRSVPGAFNEVMNRDDPDQLTCCTTTTVHYSKVPPKSEILTYVCHHMRGRKCNKTCGRTWSKRYWNTQTATHQCATRTWFRRRMARKANGGGSHVSVQAFQVICEFTYS